MHFLRVIVFCATLSSGAVFAWADNHGKAADASPAETRIEVDEKADEIRFIIKGETAAVLTENGFSVEGDVAGKAFLHEDALPNENTDREGEE